MPPTPRAQYLEKIGNRGAMESKPNPIRDNGGAQVCG